MQHLKIETLSLFNVRVRSEEKGGGFVLPTFDQLHAVVAVKIVYLQTYTQKGTECRRLRKQTHPKSVVFMKTLAQEGLYVPF